MDQKDLTLLLKRQSRNHIFNRFRHHIFYLVCPMFVLFGVVDYLYARDFAPMWILMRISYVAILIGVFQFLKNSRIRNHYSEWVAVSAIFFATATINIMIYQYEGVRSLYITGLILTTITGISMFRLNRKFSLMANVMSYFPTMLIIALTATPSEYTAALVNSSFLLGMIGLTWIYSSSDEAVHRLWVKTRKLKNQELEKYRKTEFLKTHFPQALRQGIEAGDVNLPKRQIYSNAVVGFADITSSTEIANSVDLETDWNLKERFLSQATKRATQCGLIVLTHTGDGFLFLANFNDKEDWAFNVISFYELLVSDFEKIKKNLLTQFESSKTGVKCSVAMGEAVVGFIGEDQSFYTAIGPDVNLAARLCGVAENNEVVISKNVWARFSTQLIGWNSRHMTYDNIKGFSGAIEAIHVKPRTIKQNFNNCPHCGGAMAVVKTEDGFIDMQCPEGHDILQFQGRSQAA